MTRTVAGRPHRARRPRPMRAFFAFPAPAGGPAPRLPPPPARPAPWPSASAPSRLPGPGADSRGARADGVPTTSRREEIHCRSRRWTTGHGPGSGCAPCLRRPAPPRRARCRNAGLRGRRRKAPCAPPRWRPSAPAGRGRCRSCRSRGPGPRPGSRAGPGAGIPGSRHRPPWH